jgi:hypothetical protein
MKEQNLEPIIAKLKSGNEYLEFDKTSVGFTLLDFWRWSVSDILSNASRGRFAEFIVGTAIDLKIENLRNEWDAFDLKTKDGIKIEIKSASYIQSWRQKKFSTISFSIKEATHMDNIVSMKRSVAKRHADIYVFCLLKHKDQLTIDPLQLDQWEFYVLPTIQLNNYKRSKTSITLPSLQKLTSAVNYDKLKDNIYVAYNEQNKEKD